MSKNVITTALWVAGALVVGALFTPARYTIFRADDQKVEMDAPGHHPLNHGDGSRV